MDITPFEVTDEMLASIDAIVSKGVPTFCAATHPDVDQLNDLVRSTGFVKYAQMEDFRFRRPYERSLWSWREDTRCVPELYLLAVIRYGVLPPNMNARWTDGDSFNRSIDNVSLMKVSVPGVDGRIARNKLGVQAGTPEYRKKYFENPENRERQRLHARESSKKRRRELQAARLALQQKAPEKLQEMKQRELMPDLRKGDDEERLFRKISVAAQLLHEATGRDLDECLVEARQNILAEGENHELEDLLPAAMERLEDENEARNDVSPDLENPGGSGEG